LHVFVRVYGLGVKHWGYIIPGVYRLHFGNIKPGVKWGVVVWPSCILVVFIHAVLGRDIDVFFLGLARDYWLQMHI